MDDIKILGIMGFILLCVVLIDNLFLDEDTDEIYF